MVERNQIPEIKEIEPEAIRQWIGGFFETGGGIGYEVRKKYAYPYIHYTDNNKLKIEQMEKTFGGNFRQVCNENSYEWKIRGQKAAEFVLRGENFMPSRKNILPSFPDWINATREERMFIAQNHRAKDRSPTSIVDYSDLIINPAFLAGVLESRGAYYDGRRTGAKRLMVMSWNEALITAIQQKYGGTIIDNQTAKTRSLSLEISKADTLQRIYEGTKDFYLITV